MERRRPRPQPHVDPRSDRPAGQPGSCSTRTPRATRLREVAIDARTVELLREHHAEQRAYAANVRAELARDAFVLADLLTDPDGATPIHRTGSPRRSAESRSGCPGPSVRLHDLRHWFASTQLDAGEPLPAVAARIGDNVETLAKVYAHKGRRGDDHAAEAIASHLSC